MCSSFSYFYISYMRNFVISFVITKKWIYYWTLLVNLKWKTQQIPSINWNVGFYSFFSFKYSTFKNIRLNFRIISFWLWLFQILLSCSRCHFKYLFLKLNDWMLKNLFNKLWVGSVTDFHYFSMTQYESLSGFFVIFVACQRYYVVC